MRTWTTVLGERMPLLLKMNLWAMVELEQPRAEKSRTEAIWSPQRRL